MLVTVSSKVSASFRRSMIRGLAGCTFHLHESDLIVWHMLAQQSLEREDAGSAVSAGSGRLAHVGDRSSALVDGAGDLLVVDDYAVADDHRVLGPSGIRGCGVGFLNRDSVEVSLPKSSVARPGPPVPVATRRSHRSIRLSTMRLPVGFKVT